MLGRLCCKSIKAILFLHLVFTVTYSEWGMAVTPELLDKNPRTIASRLLLVNDWGDAFQGVGRWGAPVFLSGLTLALCLLLFSHLVGHSQWSIIQLFKNDVMKFILSEVTQAQKGNIVCIHLSVDASC